MSKRSPELLIEDIWESIEKIERKDTKSDHKCLEESERQLEIDRIKFQFNK